MDKHEYFIALIWDSMNGKFCWQCFPFTSFLIRSLCHTLPLLFDSSHRAHIIFADCAIVCGTWNGHFHLISFVCIFFTLFFYFIHRVFVIGGLQRRLPSFHESEFMRLFEWTNKKGVAIVIIGYIGAEFFHFVSLFFAECRPIWEIFSHILTSMEFHNFLLHGLYANNS